MGTWQSFRDGFAGRPHDDVIHRHPGAASDANSAPSINALKATLAARDIELAELRASLDDAYASSDMLAGTLRQTRNELQAATAARDHERSQSAALRSELAKAHAAPVSADIRKIADRVWRVFAKEIHPQNAVAGETAQHGFERVFKVLRSEIEGIKGNQSP